jgi:hypothetical protein
MFPRHLYLPAILVCIGFGCTRAAPVARSGEPAGPVRATASDHESRSEGIGANTIPDVIALLALGRVVAE